MTVAIDDAINDIVIFVFDIIATDIVDIAIYSKYLSYRCVDGVVVAIVGGIVDVVVVVVLDVAIINDAIVVAIVAVVIIVVIGAGIGFIAAGRRCCCRC